MSVKPKASQTARSIVLGLLAALVLGPWPASQAALAPRPGQKRTTSQVENFRLLDHEGRSHELYRCGDARVVVLFVGGNGCPIVRQTISTLKTLREQFEPQKVEFYLINANPQDDPASIVEEAREFGIAFPILKDAAQLVVRSLGVTRTAEAIAIDTKTWTIFYRGATDNRLDYGTQKPKATRTYLADALTNFLAGKKVSPAQTKVKGCAISFTDGEAKKNETVSYAEQVAPILEQRCVSCHTPGNIGPFAMSSYEKVRGWSSTIREVVLEQRMPPWHADPHYSVFANDRSLRPEEAQTLLAWIEQGAPRGQGQDPLAAGPSTTPPDWPLGKPDYVISIPEEITIPATGVIPYRYLVVDSPVPQDAWLRAAVVRAGNRKVLHHCLVFLKYPQSLRQEQPKYQGGVDGYFTGFVPGTDPLVFPEGTGKFLPKETKFVFQMHYTTTGKEEKDRTEIGLYLLPKKPERELITRAAARTKLNIPPGDPDHETQAEFQFDREAILYSFSPHMHFRGSRFKYELRYPDGRSEVVLSVPNYDFNWQTLYRLAQGKKLPAGTRLVCTGAFDNSAGNPANPDPTKWVNFGEQSFDEMFIGYFNYAESP